MSKGGESGVQAPLATKSLFFLVTDRRRFCLIPLPSTFGPRTRDLGKLPDLTPLSQCPQRRIQGPYYPALARASGQPERLIILFIKGKITMISL
jgi:hypothetical protein